MLHKTENKVSKTKQFLFFILFFCAISCSTSAGLETCLVLWEKNRSLLVSMSL